MSNSNYIFIYREDNGRVRMASQPGLRRTGKIRVTTPLATRPRPLHHTKQKKKDMNATICKTMMMCAVLTSSSEARDGCMVVGKADPRGYPHPPFSKA